MTETKQFKPEFKPDSSTFDIISRACRKYDLVLYQEPSKDHIFYKGNFPNRWHVDPRTESKEFPGYPLVCCSTNVAKIETGHALNGLDALRQEIMDDLDKYYKEKAKSEAKDETKHPMEKKGEVVEKQILQTKVPDQSKPPEVKKALPIKMCVICGEEVPHERAMECFKDEKPFCCDRCEDHLTNSNYLAIENKNIPIAKNKKEFVVGSCEAMAIQYGIPSELANLFFMKLNDGLYIKNPGLLYLGSKKGYSRIEITTIYDDKAQEYSAECKIYPKLTKDVLEGISKLDKDLQKTAFEFATQPTNGTGRASAKSVKMSTMQPFLKEMAQTRAQNRALRAFTGYGGTSAEELPEGKIEEQ